MTTATLHSLTFFSKDTNRKGRWYFGGVAGSIAVCFTHPLDTIKVHLQTQVEKTSLVPLVSKIYRHNGVLGFYNGLSASIGRQMTYTFARFGVNGYLLDYTGTKAFYTKVAISGFSGFIGGVVGTPADLVNVRMQNDIKLKPEQRRNYKHVFDGILRIYREEGVRRMFGGWHMASFRGGLMTIGQIAFYDLAKNNLFLGTFGFEDCTSVHLASSTLAGIASTALTQPADVLKTRLMNAKVGEYSSVFSCVSDIFRTNGIFGFYKGFVPAFLRLCPHTVLLWLILEKMRIHLGYRVTPQTQPVVATQKS